jgi:topoisomerase-4 subunit A
MMMAGRDDDGDLYLLASSAGFGFVVALPDLVTRNRAGKAAISVPAGAQALPPQPVHDRERDQVAAVTSGGRLLLFPLHELPVLARGKGVRIIGLHAGAGAAGGDGGDERAVRLDRSDRSDRSEMGARREREDRGPRSEQRERLVAVAALPDGAHLKVQAGKHFRLFKPAELAPFAGQRARRGALLPRGFRSVTSLEVVP